MAEFVIHPSWVDAVSSNPRACGLSPDDRVFVMEKVGGPVAELEIDWAKAPPLTGAAWLPGLLDVPKEAPDA